MQTLKKRCKNADAEKQTRAHEPHLSNILHGNSRAYNSLDLLQREAVIFRLMNDVYCSIERCSISLSDSLLRVNNLICTRFLFLTYLFHTRNFLHVPDSFKNIFVFLISPVEMFLFCFSIMKYET